MEAKVLGGIQLIGGLIAGWMGFNGGDWGVVIISIVLILMAIHHFME